MAEARRLQAEGFVQFDQRDLERPVTARFEELAARYGEKLAVKGLRHALSYGELDALMNRVGHALLNELGDALQPVVLLMENDAPMVAATVGMQKARKIAVPLHASNPPERNAFILGEVRAELILCDSENLALALSLASVERRVLCLDDLDPALPASSPGLALFPDDPVCIFYTSGSTGRPKGVMHSHRHMMQEARVPINGMRLTPQDRIGESHSPGFSATIRRMYPALLSGASLHIYDAKKRGLADLARWMAEEEVTVYGMRALFRDFLDTLNGRQSFPKIRIMKFGGDTIHPDFVDLCRRHISPDCAIVVSYASTEAGTICQNYIGPDARVEGDRVPVGRVVEGVEAMLLGEDGEPVPPGEVGEFVARSRYLSLGYWGRPDLTAAAFGPDPDGGDRRTYRTGDLGRVRPDGLLEHLGRQDFQVKVRGYRVEIGEVEAALLRLESVREVSVVARPARTGGKQLVGYVVPAVTPAPTVGELRRAVGNRLPEYMIPSAFVMMEDLPRTATGKVDRRALPEPGTERPRMETLYAAPRTPLESALARTWCEVLGFDRVGVDDDFFELGGQSLLAAQILTRTADAYGVSVALQSFFSAPTVAGHAAAVLEASAALVDEESLRRMLAEAEEEGGR